MVRHPAKRKCVDLAAEGLFQGIFTGAAFGLFMALHQRRLHPEPNVVRQVSRSIAHSIFLFSSLLSVYHGCTCVAARVRRRDDLLNACVGGAAAGLLVSLPLRSPRVIVQNAVGMGCVGGIMDRISNPPVQAAARGGYSRTIHCRASGWWQQRLNITRHPFLDVHSATRWSTALQ